MKCNVLRGKSVKEVIFFLAILSLSIYLSPAKAEETVPNLIPFLGNPIQANSTEVPHKVFKAINNHRFYFLQVDDFGYPTDFNLDLKTSQNNGLTWNNTFYNVISDTLSGHTFNYYTAELYENSTYKIWHSATSDWDIAGTRIYYSSSSDGINFTGGTLVNLPPEPNPGYDSRNQNKPFVIKVNGTYFMYYSAYPGFPTGPPNYSYDNAIACATSPDGLNWTKHGVVLEKGSAGFFDSDGLNNSLVVYDGTQFEMFYAAYQGANRFIGYAISPDGYSWNKIGTIEGLSGSPIGVFKENGQYELWYYTRPSENLWELRVATSDGYLGDINFIGFLSITMSYQGMVKDDVGGVDGLSATRSATISQDGSHVYAAGAGEDAVAVFSRNPSTGALTWVEMENGIIVDGEDVLDEVRSVTVSPDGNHVYAAGTEADTVAVFSRNATTGALAFLEVQKDNVDGVNGLDGAISVTVSPDGSHVYAAGSVDNAIAVFSRNAATGALTFVEMQKDDGVSVVDGLEGIRSVTVSPDGSHVYAAGTDDNAVAVFSRNATTGALTFVEVQKTVIAGEVPGLVNARSVVVSPDGSHVYATGTRFDTLVVFSRDAATGELTFVEVHQNGTNGVTGLDGAWSVAVSPDGGQVYATGAIDNAVAVFSRNVATGELKFLEAQIDDGVGVVDGLEGANSVVVSPDGNHVYVAGFTDSAVAAFSVEIIKGDVDSSGVVDLTDVIIAVQVAIGANPDGPVFETANVNGDGKIGIPEAIYGLQKIAGLR